MNWFSALVMYVVIWWITLFIVLPFGVRGQAEAGDIVPGSEPGAPVTSNMKRKALLTSAIAFVLWIIMCVVIIYDPFSLKIWMVGG
jgi:predicted secreted protein